MNRPVRALICGIFREEFQALPEDLRKQLKPLFPDSMLHMHPEKLDRLIRGFTADEAPCIVVYGDCCPHMKESSAAPTCARTAGLNCCEIMLGPERFRELRKLRTFFFMPEWVERWREVFTDKLGFTDPLLARQFMKESMNRLVYIDTGRGRNPLETIKEIEAFFDMPMLIETPSPRFFEQTGMLMLLGIMDEHNISSLVSTMRKLSGVLALVLRNAMLYADLEMEVQNRTRELISEREHLLKALERNKVLLKEVHHRVKNNLQIIDSLLYLQSDKSADIRVKQALDDGRGRLASMALVHAELYQSADLSSIQLESYIPRLVSTLLASAGCSPRLAWNLAPCILPLETCIPFGLIINEIITNAVKYAMGKGKKDTLAISTSLAEKYLHLKIRDNGPGLPPDMDPAKTVFTVCKLSPFKPVSLYKDMI